jgi:flagellar hook-associated protein 1 FlgK
MAGGQDSADQLDGMSFLDFYSSLAARVGRESSSAQNDQDQGTQQVAQAQNLRTQVSGVSLDEEATHLLEWQKSYQANSEVVSVISSLTTDLMNMFTAG